MSFYASANNLQVSSCIQFIFKLSLSSNRSLKSSRFSLVSTFNNHILFHVSIQKKKINIIFKTFNWFKNNSSIIKNRNENFWNTVKFASILKSLKQHRYFDKSVTNDWRKKEIQMWRISFLFLVYKICCLIFVLSLRLFIQSFCVDSISTYDQKNPTALSINSSRLFMATAHR